MALLMTGTSRSRRVAGAALLAAAVVIPTGAGAQDRVAVTVGAGGVGAGFVTDDTVYSRTQTGCTSVTQPEICRPYVLARVRGPMPSVRALGGIEVPVGKRLAIVGTVRSEFTNLEHDPTVMATAGVRFSLR